MDVKNFLDTYALIEISKGNPKFMHYSDRGFVINDLIMAEFYSVLLREEGEEIADYWLKKFEAYSLPVSRTILIEAVRFRRKHRKKNISFFDAVGYIFSVKNRLRFVTGDKEFKGFPGVDFVKK